MERMEMEGQRRIYLVCNTLDIICSSGKAQVVTEAEGSCGRSLLCSSYRHHNLSLSGKVTCAWTCLDNCIACVCASSCLSGCSSLQQKLSDVLLPLWSQRQLLGVSQASNLVLLASLSLRLLRLMLCQLLEDGHHQLRDARLMVTIFSLHTSMCSAPHSGILSTATDEVGWLDSCHVWVCCIL